MTSPLPFVRPEPKQRRARETVAKIRAAARTIVLSAGFEALNTNAIATEAGVNVATIYNYFPDKYAVLVDAFMEHEKIRTDLLAEHLSAVTQTTDIAVWTDRTITMLAEIRAEDPYQVALRNAMTAVPHLADLDRESMAEIGRGLTEAIHRWRPAADSLVIERVARFTVTLVTRILDSAFESGSADWEMVSELRSILPPYLSSQLPNS